MGEDSIKLSNKAAMRDELILMDLAQRIGQRDPAAEHQLVMIFSAHLTQFIGNKLNEQQHHLDIYQETMLRVLVKLRAGQVEKPQALKYYILSIANHLIYRAISQRNSAMQQLSDTDVESVSELDDSAFEAFSSQDNRRLLIEAIAGLKSARDRDLMTAYLAEHKDKQQVCLLLGLTGAQFDRIVSRAKARLTEQVSLNRPVTCE